MTLTLLFLFTTILAAGLGATYLTFWINGGSRLDAGLAAMWIFSFVVNLWTLMDILHGN